MPLHSTISPETDARFWKRVVKTPTCWLWQGGLNNSGYGSFCGTTAHRWAYERFKAPIPKGLHLDHLCRVRACVKPAHLEVVTQRENTLRIGGWATQHAAATHCPAGHPYDLVNTNFRRGRRYCRECERIRDRGRRDATYWREYRRKRKLAGASGTCEVSIEEVLDGTGDH